MNRTLRVAIANGLVGANSSRDTRVLILWQSMAVQAQAIRCFGSV